jgi:hypothetical protein
MCFRAWEEAAIDQSADAGGAFGRRRFTIDTRIQIAASARNGSA